MEDIDYSKLVGQQQTHDAMAMALSAVEKFHKLEALQPCLAWKPLDIIQKTIENTTQWGKAIAQCPMQKHHVSRFPWDNRCRLGEEASMDTVVMAILDFDGSTWVHNCK